MFLSRKHGPRTHAPLVLEVCLFSAHGALTCISPCPHRKLTMCHITVLQAWLSRPSLEEVESDSKRSERVVDKMQRHSADGAAERYVAQCPTVAEVPGATVSFCENNACVACKALYP